MTDASAGFTLPEVAVKITQSYGMASFAGDAIYPSSINKTFYLEVELKQGAYETSLATGWQSMARTGSSP